MTFNDEMMDLLELAAGWRQPCSILDGGCGSADTSRWLARKGCSVLGVELQLPHARGTRVEIGGVEPGRLSLLKEDLYALGARERLERFDVVALFGVLHYAGSQARVRELLHRAKDWTDEDGLLILTWIADDIPHEDKRVHLPNTAFVVETLTAMHLDSIRLKEITVEHAHGGSAHRHRIVYSAWSRRIPEA